MKDHIERGTLKLTQLRFRYDVGQMGLGGHMICRTTVAWLNQRLLRGKQHREGRGLVNNAIPLYAMQLHVLTCVHLMSLSQGSG